MLVEMRPRSSRQILVQKASREVRHQAVKPKSRLFLDPASLLKIHAPPVQKVHDELHH